MDFDGSILSRAIKATFDRRQTELKNFSPIGLTAAFSQDSQKQIQWKAFLRKNKIESVSLDETVSFVASFLLPVTDAVHRASDFSLYWNSGGPWVEM